MMAKKTSGGMKAKRITGDVITYIFLSVMCVVWLLPFFWVIMQSFRDGKGQFISTFLPTAYTLNNYKALFTELNVMNFPRMFLNTFGIACCTCLISTFFVLSVAYCTSRLKWKMRKPYMNMAMVINLFPGFMSMVAVYNILKGLGMNQSLFALVIVSAAGAAMGYHICKGFFDTIPKALDEAAIIDGATRWQIFTKITIPLSKPIAIYTLLTSFLAAWSDYIFPSMLFGDNQANYTVAIGLKWMTDFRRIDTYYTQFAAGAVVVAVPIVILFICLQKYYVEGLSGSVKG